MKAKCILGLSFLLVLASLIVTAQAPLASLNSGFCVTTDFHEQHIEPIMPGTSVTAMAAFVVESESPLTPDVWWIQFKWRSPAGLERDVDLFPPFHEGEWTDKQGVTHMIYYLNDTYTPITQGPWGIQALFRGEDGHIMGQDEAEPAFDIKAISFEVIPEVPFGTIAIVLAMFTALLVVKKKNVLKIKP